jgi:hypothetical protein
MHIAGAQWHANVADVRATAAACRVYAQARRLGVNFRTDDTGSSIAALVPRVIPEPIGRASNDQVRANSTRLAPSLRSRSS